MSKNNYLEVQKAMEGIVRDASRTIIFRNKSWYSTKSLPEMSDYIKRVDINLDDVDGLNIIHVSGTKGKGSVSAFCESILRANGFKTGLYSSPHLVEFRERIRINGLTLTKDVFSKYFFDVYNKLESTKCEYPETMLSGFRFMTLMALNVFIHEKVDVVILEVGVGGAYDCTNIVQSPRVVGITLLDLDHTNLLGNTIDSIAWHKAGICKPGRPAFTIPQVQEAMNTLRCRANEIHATIQIVPDLDDYDWQGKPMKLGLAGEHQRINASLAIQLCRTWIEEHNLHHSNKRAGFGRTNTYSMDGDIQTASAFKLPATFISGLRDCCLPGRTQIVKHDNVTYYLDGAHTPMSMKAGVKWFKEASAEEKQTLKNRVAKVLIFNVTHGRDAKLLLEHLGQCNFAATAFSPDITDVDDLVEKTFENLVEELTICKENRGTFQAMKGELYDALPSKPTSASFVCAMHAVQWAACGKDPYIPHPRHKDPTPPQSIMEADHVQVLVTGSLLLVGRVIGILVPDFVANGNVFGGD
ncbi:folylpolyglutamate synthase, mitochondrial-like [Saccoglossus kowalevskii]|uniref:Folylpolyglutamate synthase n=1 Tax=Saccoglossus kowalevskii TaxID=10224 RepID=A0ABM0MDM3_SACKO|nr:PREDICTED: folylpolyglutamate synthase, mitochondrial-like [Saccoglossus kowalevskii]